MPSPDLCQAGRVRDFADTASGPLVTIVSLWRLRPFLPAASRRLVPDRARPRRCPVVFMSPLLAWLTRQLHERDTCRYGYLFTSVKHPPKPTEKVARTSLHVVRWRMSDTPYRSFAPFFFRRSLVGGPAAPSSTALASPATLTKSVFAAGPPSCWFPRGPDRRQRILCERVIATPMPCALKPLRHRDSLLPCVRMAAVRGTG